MVEPELLCRDHLLGEHNELHKLVGSIRNHPHGHAIADGQAAKGNIDTSLIQHRHDQLVKELERRGYEHDSPLDWSASEYYAGIGAIDIDENLSELAQRCSDCSHRIDQSKQQQREGAAEVAD